MSPLDVPISLATSRTVVDARPLRLATASAASTIASRRSTGDIRATRGAYTLLRNRPIADYHGRLRPTRAGSDTRRDPDDAIPRPDERPQRDGPLGALVELPGGAALPDVREVRVLRNPQCSRRLRHVAALQVPLPRS